eukprot:scaffold99745_cov66-Phaeocystis_antarctica.AAC.3
MLATLVPEAAHAVALTRSPALSPLLFDFLLVFLLAPLLAPLLSPLFFLLAPEIVLLVALLAPLLTPLLAPLLASFCRLAFFPLPEGSRGRREAKAECPCSGCRISSARRAPRCDAAERGRVQAVPCGVVATDLFLLRPPLLALIHGDGGAGYCAFRLLRIVAVFGTVFVEFGATG